VDKLDLRPTFLKFKEPRPKLRELVEIVLFTQQVECLRKVSFYGLEEIQDEGDEQEEFEHRLTDLRVSLFGVKGGQADRNEYTDVNDAVQGGKVSSDLVTPANGVVPGCNQLDLILKVSLTEFLTIDDDRSGSVPDSFPDLTSKPERLDLLTRFLTQSAQVIALGENF